MISNAKLFTAIFIIVFFVPFLCGAQKRPFRTVTVDLDQGNIDSLLPIEESFYLKLVSARNFNVRDYRLLRILNGSSIFGREITYYKNIELDNKIPAQINVSPTIAKYSEIEKTTNAGTTENTVTKEYPSLPIPLGDPIAAINKYTVTLFMKPLQPNFYYYIIPVNATQGGQIDDETVPSNFVIADAVHAVNSIPLGNTALDPSENLNRHITASFGAAFVTTPNRAVSPYLGLRYNLFPVNKWVRQGMSGMETQNEFGTRFFRRLAIDIGVSTTSLKDSANRVKDLIGNFNLLTGVGVRIANYSYFSFGALWRNKIDELDKYKTNIHGDLYLSLTLDWDIAKTFNSFAKALGIGI